MVDRLSAVRVAELVASGEAALVDLRPPADFARGHPRGALNVPFSARGLARRIRLVLPRGTGVVLLAPDAATAEAALGQLDDELPVRGVVEGGAAAWRAGALPEDALAEVGVEELARAEALTVIDVREPIEWESGHVPGALLIPLGRLRHELARVPRERRAVVICEAGVRSSTGASILQAAGFSDVAHVPAGTAGYRRAGLPLAVPDKAREGLAGA